MIEKLKEILRHRQLILILVSRELKACYRGTMLGFFWSLFNPLPRVLLYANLMIIRAVAVTETYLSLLCVRIGMMTLARAPACG